MSERNVRAEIVLDNRLYRQLTALLCDCGKADEERALDRPSPVHAADCATRDKR